MLLLLSVPLVCMAVAVSIDTVNLENFIVKIFRSRWELRRLACIINANAVRGHSYEIFLYKIYCTKVSLHENFQIYGTCAVFSPS